MDALHVYYCRCIHDDFFPNRQSIRSSAIRELFFINTLQNAGDYQVNNYIFEIGGKSKKEKQIREVKSKAFCVKDDVLIGSKSTIPLYLFGFLY